MSWLGSGSPTEWAVFTAVVGTLLVLDLFVVNRGGKPIGTRQALVQAAWAIGIAILFGLYIWAEHGSSQALLYYTGFLVEKALSVDNLFVFLVIFSYFGARPEHQRRVLSWGIISAVVLRGLMIFVGAALINRFHWILYVFGAFLIYTAWKLLTHDGAEVHPEKNPVLRLLRRVLPMSDKFDDNHFFTRMNGKLAATPLLAVLAVVETTDVIFALDSVPAIFAITTDTFLVYTSNIFAILGLRALYFALAAMMGRFRYLNVGLSLVLAFIGSKMLAGYWHLHVPPGISLAVVVLLLGGSIAVSLLRPAPAVPPPPPGLPAPDPPEGTESGTDAVPTAKTGA